MRGFLALLLLLAVVGACSDSAGPVEPAVVQLQRDSIDAESLGQEITFVATVLTANGQLLDNIGVRWAVQPNDVAEHLGDGRFITRKAGTAFVTASLPEKPEVRARGILVVRQVARRISITPDSVRLTAIDDRVGVQANITDANGNAVGGAALVWQSSNLAVARVDSAGTITAVGRGTATIVATSGKTPNAVQAQVIAIVQPIPASLTVDPRQHVLRTPNDTVRVRAAIRDRNGHPVDGVTLIWQSTNDGVATVDASGLVRAHAPGVVSIIGRAGGVADSLRLTVSGQPATVTLTPADTTIDLGGTAQLRVTISDAFGSPLATSVTWSSTNPAVAAVDSFGRVTGLMGGNAQIEAVSGGARGIAVIRVAGGPQPPPPPPAGATVTKVSGDLQSGPAGSTLPLPLVVRVRDNAGNPVPNATVQWRVAFGGGTVTPGTASTDANGHAQTSWTLGSLVGVQTVEVSVPAVGSGTLVFSANATEPPPPPPPPPSTALRWIGGNALGPNNWHNAANWSPARVPGSADDVIIGPSANIPTLVADAVVDEITFEPGGSVNSSTFRFTANAITGVANFTGAGIVQVALTDAIQGAFPHLNVSSAGGVSADGPISVRNTLTGSLISPNGFTVNVAGDVTIWLSMTNPTDHVIVGGNFRSAATAPLAAGRVTIHGNLITMACTSTTATVFEMVGGNQSIEHYGGFHNCPLEIGGTGTKTFSYTAPASLRVTAPVVMQGTGSGGSRIDVLRGDISTVAGSTLNVMELHLWGNALMLQGNLGPHAGSNVVIFEGTNQAIGGRHWPSIIAGTGTYIAGPAVIDNLRNGVTLQANASVGFYLLGLNELRLNGHTLVVDSLFQTNSGRIVLTAPNDTLRVRALRAVSSGGNQLSGGVIIANGFQLGRTGMALPRRCSVGEWTFSGTRLVLQGPGAYLAPCSEAVFGDIDVTGSAAVISGETGAASPPMNYFSNGTLTVYGSFDNSGFTGDFLGSIILKQGSTLRNSGTLKYGGSFVNEGGTVIGNPPVRR
jgi:hypothetical protein